MFERFGCQAFFLANQGPLSLYSMGLTSGLCLNSGFCTTQAIPVYEGHSLPYCTRQLDIGGQQITNYLGRQLLSERSLAFSSSSEKFLLADMMERYCYVPLGKLYSINTNKFFPSNSRPRDNAHSDVTSCIFSGTVCKLSSFSG